MGFENDKYIKAYNDEDVYYFILKAVLYTSYTLYFIDTICTYYQLISKPMRFILVSI